jgi:hypothetical protein
VKFDVVREKLIYEEHSSGNCSGVRVGGIGAGTDGDRAFVWSGGG